ncbi:hypothetical protein [Bradyrhizobium sp. ISRA442]|uniref:hypothetical protein n=1 Tax=Bradyrhizobium sp. ISRA442 TaxID=2866197 RepID=UPI00311AC7DB
MAARTEGALRHFLEHVVAADGFDDFVFDFLAVFAILDVSGCLGMRRLGALAGRINGVGGLGGGGHGFGEGLGVSFLRGRFGSRRLLRLGGKFGGDNGLGSHGRDRGGRLVVVIMVARLLIVLARGFIIVMMMRVMLMIVTMLVVPMLVMIVVVVMGLERTGMLGIGVQMLALVRDALGALGQQLALDRLGNGIRARLEAIDDVALDTLAMTAAAGVAMARAAAAVGTILVLLLGFAMGLLLGLDQRLPVGDRDLIVVGMDFAEGEEAVAVAAIFHKGGLERGFDPGDLGEVDISAQLLALRGLEIKLFDAIAADHDDPGLFRVGGIDQHLVGHVLALGGGGRDSPWARIAPPGDATVHLIRG